MAACALNLLTDAERRQQMGQAGRHRALRDFCSSKIIPLYEELYRRVIENT